MDIDKNARKTFNTISQANVPHLPQNNHRLNNTQSLFVGSNQKMPKVGGGGINANIRSPSKQPLQISIAKTPVKACDWCESSASKPKCSLMVDNQKYEFCNDECMNTYRTQYTNLNVRIY